MGEIINFRQAKKRRDRQDKEKRSDGQRALFGRPKVEKEQTAAERDKAKRLLDAHKRGHDDEPA